MTIAEMSTLVAKVALGDNRQVDELTIAYWHETIGDLDLQAALDALRRFRRERPGVYLEPGHLLEFAGVADPEPTSLKDFTGEVLAESKRRALATLGYTPEQFDNDEAVRADVVARWRQDSIDTLPPSIYDDRGDEPMSRYPRRGIQ